MSNALTFFDAQLPALSVDVAKALAEANDDFSGGLGSSFRRIALRSGRFRQIEGGIETILPNDSLTVGIVATSPKVRRQFFMVAYEAGSKEPPTCWSNDGDRPANDVPADQRQSNACMTCPQNEKGSAKNGEGRACSFRKNIVVCPADNGEGGLLSPDTPAKPWLMTINAMSMFGKSQEADALFTMTGLANLLRTRTTPAYPRGLPVSLVSLQIQIDHDAAVPKVWFKPVGILPQFAVIRSMELAKSVEVETMMNMSAADAVEAEGPTTERDFTQSTPAATPKPAAATPAATPKPVAATPAATPKPVAATPVATPKPAGRHWIEFAHASDVSKEDIDTLIGMGGPGTERGAKYWGAMIGVSLVGIDTSLAAPAAAATPAVAKVSWREYGAENGAEEADLDMIEEAGGPGTAKGLKLWTAFVGAELIDEVDLGPAAAATPVAAAAPAEPKRKPGRPAGTKNKPKDPPAEEVVERVVAEPVETPTPDPEASREAMIRAAGAAQAASNAQAEFDAQQEAGKAQTADALAQAITGFATGQFDD